MYNIIIKVVRSNSSGNHASRHGGIFSKDMYLPIYILQFTLTQKKTVAIWFIPVNNSIIFHFMILLKHN